MRIRLQRAASAQLRAITNHIARDNPAAAKTLVGRINDHFVLMADTGFIAMGQAGPVEGTRRIIEGRYVVTYRYDETRREILIVSIVHGARRR